MLVGTKVVGVRRAVWIAIAGIVLYTLLVGADAAVVRATIMGGVFVPVCRACKRVQPPSSRTFRTATQLPPASD